MTASDIIRVKRFLLAFSQVASMVAVGVGTTVIVGWIFDISILKSIHPSMVSMKANTAACFILGGLSLWFHLKSQTARSIQGLGKILASLVALIGLLTLAEYAFKVNLGIDQLLVHEPVGTVGTFSPGRMAMNAAIGFSLLGLALLAIDAREHWQLDLSQVLALTAGLLGLVSTNAYIFGIAEFEAYSRFVQMALHTAAAFVVLSLGVLFARPERGGMAVITSDGLGGYIARRLLPAAILLPLTISWATSQGERLGLYGALFGDVISATLYIAIAVGLAWFMARRLNRMDEERMRAEHELERFFDLVPDMVCIAGNDGYFKRLNTVWEKTLGFSTSELLAESLFNFIHPDDVGLTLAEIQKQLAGKSTINFVNRYRCKDGGYRTLEWGAQPSPDGRTLYAAARDITEKEARARELTLLAQALASIGESVSITDETDKILYVNDAFSKIYGYEREEALGKNIRMIRSPLVPEHVQNEILPATKKGGWDGEIVNRRKNGSDFPLELSTSAVLDSGGVPIAYIGVGKDVTDRKRAEEKLREIWERFQSVVESASDAIVTMKEDGSIASWNHAAEKIFGYSTQSALGLPMTLLMPQRYREAHIAGLQRFLLTGETKVIGNTIELMGLKQNGSEFPMELSLAEMHVGGGRMFTGMMRDITDRKLIEQKLTEREKSFRELFDEAPVGYHELDANGRITRVNQTELTMLGYRYEEMQGKLVWDFLDEAEASRTSVLAKLSGTKVPAKGLERVYRRKNGSTIPVLSEDLLLKDKSGRICGIRTTLQDISELKRAQEMLRVSEERHRTLVFHMAEGVAVVDEQERFTFANPAAENIFGVPPGTLVGHALSDFVDPAEFARIREQTTKRRSGETAVYEIQTVRPDYARRYLLATVSPLVSNDNGFGGSIGIFRDITDRKLAEREREKLIEEMKTALENVNTLDGLLAICAHCKKIRDGEGTWNQLEKYLTEHTDVKFTHGLCPDCVNVYFPGRG